MRPWMLALALTATSPAWAAKGAGVGLPALPDDYDGGTGGTLDETPWWEAFGQSDLSGLIEEGLSGNRDLGAARDRIAMAKAMELTALSAILPTLSFDGNINAQPASLRFAGFTGGEAEDIDEGLYYMASAGFNAGLAIDLSGRNILGVQAAHKDAAASGDDADQAAVSLASRIAGAWMDVAVAASRQALIDTQLQAIRQVLEVVEIRLQRGEATAVDVLQQRQQLAATQAQLPLVRASKVLAEKQLAVLMGRTPDQVPDGLPTALPEVPPAPLTGSPRDLLEARPDLRAAESRLTSAWQRRMAAERAWVPSLRLSANAGWNFTNNAGSSAFGGGTSVLDALAPLEPIVQQFDPTFEGFGAGEEPEPAGYQQWFSWSMGAQVSFPIFQGGRNIAALKQARAAERAAANQFSAAQLNALTAVEAALSTDREQRLRLDAVRDQAVAADSAFRAASARYADGIGDYLTVLTTLVTKQTADIQALQAHRDALGARIQLHEALGGPWTRTLDGGSR